MEDDDDKNNNVVVPKWTMLLLSLLLGPSLASGGGGVEKEPREEDGGRLLVCYYANWSIYRPGVAKFTPENIDPFLCTHLIYAFAGMNKDYELKPFDSYNDLQLGNYKKFTNLKSYNPKLKVMIAVGGWNEGSKRFSSLVESPSGRSRFVGGAVSFLRKHGFDGLDLDWEYPGSRDGGRDSDKEGYRKLVEELRSAFDSEPLQSGRSRLLLTMAVPAGKQYIDRGYDVPALSRQLDFMNLLTYDYHTSQEAEVRHHAPLGREPDLEDWNPNAQLNVEWTVGYYIDLGCDPSKLVLGIPTYGRSFALADPEETDPGAPAKGPGDKGEATREAGYLAYYEICQLIQDQEWELEAPRPELEGPYAYKEDQWVGFDDEDIILEKAKFIIREGLGGGMVWTLDNDDFRGKCYGVQSPLIRALKSALQEEEAAAEPQQITAQVTKEKKKSSPIPSAVPRFTTPDPGIPFQCEDEGFFNHPTDCKKYFWCLDGGPSGDLVAHAFTCPSGLHFNKQRDACDYAGNVVCRVRKTTAVPSTTTTAQPRPRPRTRKTTTTAVPTTTRSRPKPRTRKTTTTTTTTPTALIPAAPKTDQQTNDVDSSPNSQSIAELLRLLKRLGVDQLQDRLLGQDGTGDTTPAPDRHNTETSLFLQYAQPVRKVNNNQQNNPTGGGEGLQRGPQFRGSISERVEETEDKHSSTEEEEEEEEEEEKASLPTNGSDFPFVYHTPSRSKTTTAEEEKEQGASTSTSPPRRRVVVKVNPSPRNQSRTAEKNQRRRPKPQILAETTQSQVVHPQKTVTRHPELVVLATGRPAIPAPTRKHHLPKGVEDSTVRRGGPTLARLPDGSITCLRRGVHPHPEDCGRFIVCVPGTEGEELDGFIHDCPRNARFVEEKGRCTVEAEGSPCRKSSPQ